MKKIFTFFFIILLVTSIKSQVVINEVMYSPSSNTEQEWFEIYNSGNYSLNMLQWKWKDATSTLRTITTSYQNLQPYQYAIICQDSAAVRLYHPGFSGLIFQTNWSTLNNDTDNVILIDGSGFRIDSLRYISAWGGTNGYSLERINPVAPTNNSSNWGSSVDLQKSTPNRLNSVTPKQNDLKLYSISYSPLSPRAGDTLFLKFQIKNIGLNPANNFSLNIYRNLNLDSIVKPSELINTQNFTSLVLNPNDSLTYTYYIVGIDSGLKQYIGKIIYAPDNDTINNSLVKNVNVGSSGIVNSSLVINEIMYHPLPSTECEWIELFNNTHLPVNIKNWKISDSTSQSNPIIITENNKIIDANDYLVIAKNNSIVNNHRLIDTNKIVYLPNLPTLNDDKDVIIIYDYLNNIIDRVAYKSSWGGNSSENSLERVTPNRPSYDSTNWATSLDCEHSSPTRTNSLSNLTSYTRNDLIVNEIMYDPLTISCEWIEFYNFGTKYLNLSGWRLKVSSILVNLFDTCNFVINPGQYLVIAKDTTIFNRFSNLNNPDPNCKIIFSNNLSLSNEGAMLIVLDALGNSIDSVYYNPKWHNSNLPDTKGYSLERINPLINANDRNNWNSCTALSGGTPGAGNSILTSNNIINGSVSVSPNPFSPDGDGFEDFTIIKYKLKQNISQLRVKVYDVKGRLVRTLLNNQLSGNEGQIIFDGKNDNGEKLRIGIYILFIEAINDMGGAVEQVKTTVVVASKL
ncbi:MAG: lamin tail domain-containing protein [Ignavibacteria bacterium]|jgi:hypothetical protein